MFKDIPFCFTDRNEDYLVIDKLQEFCKENNLSTTLDKPKLINSIVKFAKASEKNNENVMEWFEDTLKEGIKKILLTKVQNLGGLKNKSIEDWKKIIEDRFKVNESEYIINTKNCSSLKLCGFKFFQCNNVVDVVSLNFTILLKEKKKKDLPYNTIIYPIFVDIYLKEGYVVGRAKSKSFISKFSDHISEDIENEEVTYNPTTYDKLIKDAFEKIYLKLNIQRESNQNNMHIFKTAIHNMVDECTKTPAEIVTALEKEEEFREEFVKDFFKRQSINPFTNENYFDALEDMKIFMEKYISINTEDKKTFTTNRYAYPIQISATDSDFSSVEECSLQHVPLQCTSIFFDNKKLIQKGKKCDNVCFMFEREPKQYFTNPKFPVILEVKKGYMYVDFRKYTLEEDIKSVLFRVIRRS